MGSARRVVVAISILLLIVSVRTVFVGYGSYTPLVFAQLYIGLFAVLMMFPTLIRTNESAAGDHLILLFVAASVGAVLFSLAAPRIGEPNYCGQGDLLYEVVRVPKVYRCTSAPFLFAGWFAGWWITIWAVDWWRARVDAGSSRTASTAERIFAVFAVVLLIVAVSKLFVGSDSFKPLVFAEIWIFVFTLFIAVLTLIRTEQITEDPDWFLLMTAALVGAVVFWNVAPQFGEPNYCMPLPRGLRVLQDMASEISRSVGVTPQARVRPTLFRCTSIPFAIAGGFAGWWIALWASGRSKSQRDSEL
jgi:hypothetical protein